MSALMAERRDFAEDPRQASLFDALAPPPERLSADQAPREKARIVEFPARREARADDETLAGDVGEGARACAAPASEPADAPTKPPSTTARADAAWAGAASLGPAPSVEEPPAVERASAIETDILGPPAQVGDSVYTPKVAGAPLAGPTLDDVMSRVWEGLVTGLPAACPVCHGEVLPSASGPRRGRCASCDTTID
jgi:hypothetical protein